MTMPSAPTDEIENERVSAVRRWWTGDDVYFLIADLIRAERTQRLDRLSLQHLFIAMPYAMQFNNAYFFGIKLSRARLHKGPRLRSN
jgi:hypothetical protein